MQALDPDDVDNATVRLDCLTKKHKKNQDVDVTRL